MTKHLEFFRVDITEAAELSKKINWKWVLGQYEVFGPFLSMLASQIAHPERPGAYPDLQRKLEIVFDQPCLSEPHFKKLRNETLFEVCHFSSYFEPVNTLDYANKLIRAGADVNFRSERKRQTCLQAAIGNDALLKFLIDAGAVTETDGKPLLFSSQRAETVDLLFSNGLSWKSVDAASIPQQLSFMKLQPLKAMVKAMSVDGFAIDAGGWKGKTVLHYLALQGGVAELSYLISLVKKIDMATDDKRTALMYACHRTDESAVKCVGLLLEGGASVRAADENGKTALMWAVEETADRAVVAEILKRKPDLDAHDKFGNTALHYCAARTRDAHLTHVIAQMLLDAGADINATNTYGHTALMLLAQNTPKACSLLVQSGAAVDVKDHAGYTVRDYANAESKKVLAELIGKATLPIGHNPKELPITATVVRDKKTLKQIEKASTLRSELVLRIQEWVAVQKGAPDVLEPWPNILLAAQLGSEAIKVGMEQVVPEEVDRMGSMLSGPFFVSKNYPMVEKGYPVVQLDLRLASLLSGKSLGDGLLQLWEIPRKMSLHVRVIPREAVNANLMQPFEVRKLCKQDKTALYPFWESDPAAGVVKMFHSYESLGFQTDDLEYELSEALEEGNTIDSIIERALQSAGLSATQKKNKSNEATKRRLAPAALIKLANRFNESLAEPSGDCNLQLFGTFPFLQYSMVSVGKNCLFTIPYGASGSAQVFFEIDSRGKVSFSTNFTTR